MPVPLSQMLAVTRHVFSNRVRKTKRYALVLMLEPLFRCNLACPGCGKIQHPPDLLKRHLSPAQCLGAAEECGAPIISICGGEPLLHPQITEIVAGLVARRKYVYLCTNGLKLREMLGQFAPSKRLVLSIHLDGLKMVHDRAVDRAGVYDTAVAAIDAALEQGFRVTTNTTLFNDAVPGDVQRHLDRIMSLGVEGMMVSPGYPYRAAADQEGFLQRRQTERFFSRLFAEGSRRWRFNQTPLFLEFLRGNFELECTPWGNPTYNVLGWQRPCYLLDEGYCQSFAELLGTTRWERYGRASGNRHCVDCMVHCGFEPSAVAATFGTLRGAWATARWMLGLRRSGRRTDPELSREEVGVPAHGGPSCRAVGDVETQGIDKL